MTDIAKKFTDEALLLPREDRAEIIDKLLQSLNLQAKAKIDSLWSKEAEKRIKEYEEGKVKSIDGKQVFKEIRDRLKR